MARRNEILTFGQNDNEGYGQNDNRQRTDVS
jgi:hypothetical protein